MKNSNLPLISTFVLLSAFYWNPLHARPGSSGCTSGQEVHKTFSSGAAWDMCWEERAAEGVVFTDIYYKAPGGTSIRVLGEAALSQIQTDYDDGAAVQYHVSQAGLGGDSLQALTSQDCSGGQLSQSGGRNILCQHTKPYGFVYKESDTNQRQGERLELFSVSKVNNLTYVVRWRFYESGIIEPATGLSGTLTRMGADSRYGWPITRGGNVAVGFTDNYFWRMDFDIGTDNSNDIVEEMTSVPSADRLKKTSQISSISTETARRFDAENKRGWRIRDASTLNGSGSPISYELILLNYGHQSYGNNNEAWLQNDFFVTRYDACEKFAVKNSTQSGCDSSLDQFTNNQGLNGEDVVLWYRLSYHHLPRDEDDNRLEVRWNGFTLLPRDWSSTNPL